MKCLLIFCSEYLEGKVRTTLEKLKIGCFAEIADVMGCSGGIKHMNTPAFPGSANIFFAVVEESRTDEVKRALAELLDHCEGEKCLRCMALDAEALV